MPAVHDSADTSSTGLETVPCAMSGGAALVPQLPPLCVSHILEELRTAPRDVIAGHCA